MTKDFSTVFKTTNITKSIHSDTTFDNIRNKVEFSTKKTEEREAITWSGKNVRSQQISTASVQTRN